MASAREYSPRTIDKTCCKCSKSDEKMNEQKCPTFLGDAVSKFEERRGDLKNREKYLRQKITTMERSIPALIAFNMLKSSDNPDDSPLCKIKQMMKKLSPQLDPTDKLLDKLENTVKSLNGETAELHDKIIAADINLEESEMELESLEMANKELEGTLKSLEKELKSHETPSLHSIHSDDLVCLSKICQLGEAEVNLKNSIRDLEERECLLHRQMDRILKSKEFRQASCVGITKKIRQLESSEKKMHCALHKQKSSMQQLKKTLVRNGMEQKSMTNCVCKSSVCYDESSCPATSSSANKCLERSVSSLKSCCTSLASKYNVPRGQDCKNSKNLTPTKSTSYKGDTPVKALSKCPGYKVSKPCLDQRSPIECRCSCKGKCANVLSDMSCNCAENLSSVDNEDCQQSGDSSRNNDHSSTDEEYCECCDCGCEDSDLSDTV